MNHGMISKIQKAKEYAQERDRFTFTRLAVDFRGDNANHKVAYIDGRWSCDCEYFMLNNVCSHTMALERLLVGMLPESEVTPPQA